MSLKECKKLETNRYELEVEVDAESFKKAIDRAYKKQVKSINVPGFRKGKAPKNIIEKMYGEGVFYEDAIEDVYPQALDNAVNEAKLRLVRDEIGFDVVEVGKNGLIFKAAVTTYPELEIADYKNMEYIPQSAEVTEEDLSTEIDMIRDRNSRTVTVEGRSAKVGDIAVIDFEGFKDGVAFEGGKAENYNLTLGAGQFIPGFEEQIVGHNPGDEFEISVTFPEDYQAEELAGALVVFKIVLHEIKMKELPALDDEFVKDVSDKETVEEYKEEVRQQLALRLENSAKRAKENQLCQKLVDKLVADIPEAMFKSRQEALVKEMDSRLRSQGLDLETYLQYMGMSEDDLMEQNRAQAEGDVKLRLALEKIAELEKLEVSDEAVAEEYKKLAEAYKIEEAQVKMFVPESEITFSLKLDAALKLVLDSAKEAKSEAKKTTAKKTAEKKTTEKKTAEKKPAAKKTTTKKTTKASEEKAEKKANAEEEK